jgi:hypothetical protein
MGELEVRRSHSHNACLCNVYMFVIFNTLTLIHSHTHSLSHLITHLLIHSVKSTCMHAVCCILAEFVASCMGPLANPSNTSLCCRFCSIHDDLEVFTLYMPSMLSNLHMFAGNQAGQAAAAGRSPCRRSCCSGHPHSKSARQDQPPSEQTCCRCGPVCMAQPLLPQALPVAHGPVRGEH